MGFSHRRRRRCCRRVVVAARFLVLPSHQRHAALSMPLGTPAAGPLLLRVPH